MKKRLKEIFSISRNERIGLLCIIVVVGLVLIVKCEPKSETPAPGIDNASALLKENVDSASMIQTKKKRGKKSKKQENKDIKHLTTSSMEEVKQE